MTQNIEKDINTLELSAILYYADFLSLRDISLPVTDSCKYFDIAIFFAPNFVEKKWRKLSSDTEAYISKKDMNIDYSAKPTFAIEVKEKSAYVPLTFGDKALTVGGSVLLIQVPKDKLSQI